MIHDVTIIGAGPAGCTAAIRLADAGYSVTLLEKNASGGEKICGDALSGTVMNVLDRLPRGAFADFMKLEDKFPSWGIRFCAPCGDFLDVPFVEERKENTPVPGYLLTRKSFDSFLRGQLQKYPSISFMQDFKADEILRYHEKIIIRGNGKEILSKMVIGADGINSRVAKTFLKKNPETSSCLGARTYYRGIKDLHPENFIELHFLKELLPGYLWIFPMANGMANVGLGMLTEDVRKKKIVLSQKLDDLVQNHPFLRNRFEGAEKIGKTGAHSLPMGPPSCPLSGERFLLTGDAAALVDSFTGEGIGNAMMSGEIAAEVAAEAISKNDFSEGFLLLYDEKIRKKMFGELQTSQRLQKLVAFPWLFDFVVRKVNAKPQRLALFTKMYTDAEARKKLKNPLFYLELFFG